MAIWEVRAVFKYGDRFWENVWHLDIGELEDFPVGAIVAVSNFSLDTLLNVYELVKIVRRPAGTSDAFVESIANTPGNRSAGADVALPLFDTVRLVLEGGVGRPGQKFLRGLLLLNDIAASGGVLKPAVIALVEAAATTLISDLLADDVQIVVGSTNKVVLSASAESDVQERQLHRKRRRSI